MPDPVLAPLLAVQSQSWPDPRIPRPSPIHKTLACGMLPKAPCFLIFDSHGCTGFFQETTGLHSRASAIPRRVIAEANFSCRSVPSRLSCASCASMFNFRLSHPPILISPIRYWCSFVSIRGSSLPFVGCLSCPRDLAVLLRFTSAPSWPCARTACKSPESIQIGPPGERKLAWDHPGATPPGGGEEAPDSWRRIR